MPAPAARPSFRMLRIPALIALLVSMVFTAACGGGGPSNGPSIGSGDVAEARSGQMAGRVTYEDGRPLAGATVVAVGIEYEVEIVAETGTDGSYAASIEQRDATYRLSAWMDAEMDGSLYHFPLEPVGDPDTHFSGEDGIARDFTWKLTGVGSWSTHLQPGHPESFIGGSLWLYDYDPNTDPASDHRVQLPVGSVLEVTFTPTTALVDGTVAEATTREITIEEPAGRYSPVAVLTDVPLAPYVISMRARYPDGAVRDLVLSAKCAVSGCPIRPPALGVLANLDFVPADPSTHVRPYQGQPTGGVEVYFQAA